MKPVVNGTFSVRMESRSLRLRLSLDLMRSDLLENYDKLFQGEDAGTEKACQWP
jgi:hypothetical protein